MKSPISCVLRRSADQRLAMYRVISMPNRNSTAYGVSHFISTSFECAKRCCGFIRQIGAANLCRAKLSHQDGVTLTASASAASHHE